MRKAVLLTLCGAFLLVAKSQAQVFVTSVGVVHQVGVPAEVCTALDYNYPGYAWVHAQRIIDNGYLSFQVVLQRGDAFITVNLDPYGRINRQVVSYAYPLSTHICNDYCGYHSAYYNQYVTVYPQQHNHVVYVPNYHSNHVVVYNQSGGQSYHSGNNHNQYQTYNGRSSSNNNGRSSVTYSQRPTSVKYTQSNQGRSTVSHTNTNSGKGNSSHSGNGNNNHGSSVSYNGRH